MPPLFLVKNRYRGSWDSVGVLAFSILWRSASMLIAVRGDSRYLICPLVKLSSLLVKIIVSFQKS